MRKSLLTLAVCFMLVSISACSDHGHDGEHAHDGEQHHDSIN